MIALEHLRKTYGTIVAVESVSFVAPDGVVTGLLGPNGAGKTTALRVITGLVRPDAGSASVDGRDVQRDPMAVRARLGGDAADFDAVRPARLTLFYDASWPESNRQATRAANVNGARSNRC